MTKQRKPEAVEENPAEDGQGKPATMRVPADVKEWIDVITQHKLNGWTSAAQVLSDRTCPLREWLFRLYKQALREKEERAKK